MIHVFMDDVRRCPKGFVHARTAEECILLLEQEEVDILSLDYDLGWNQPTGSEVARFIASTGKFPKRIFLHTSSHLGKINMYDMLHQTKPDEVQLHNGPMPESLILKAADMLER